MRRTYNKSEENAIRLPKLNPLVRIGIKRFINKVENAGYYSRQFNVVLPELLLEALRIEREGRK